jgi:hypothetical protein
LPEYFPEAGENCRHSCGSESIIFTRAEEISGQVVILVLEKDKVREIN